MNVKRYTVRRDTPEAAAALRKIEDRITDMWGDMRKMQECVICDILRNFYKSDCWVFARTGSYHYTFLHLVEKNGDLIIRDEDSEELWGGPDLLEEILGLLEKGDTIPESVTSADTWSNPNS